jgi:hypothetical protein
LQSVVHGQEQSSDQKRCGNPAWVKGVSGNPAGKESRASRRARIDRIVADWCEPAGGTKAFNPAELALLAKAAEMTLVLPRDPGNQVRVLNSVRSVLSQCGLLGRKREPAKLSLAEYLARKNPAPEVAS